MKGRITRVCVVCFALAGSMCPANVFPLQIFTSNGMYHDNPGVNLTVDVNDGVGYANFTFYNNSTVNCSIVRIFFDDGSLLGINEIISGQGTEFSEAYPGPGELPYWELIDFHADREFNVGAEPPPPEKGVNNVPSGEWVTISFDLINSGTVEGVINELHTGALRVGIHVIAFPDDSSESAILIPEPATVSLIAIGGLVFLKRRRG